MPQAPAGFKVHLTLRSACSAGDGELDTLLALVNLMLLDQIRFEWERACRMSTIMGAGRTEMRAGVI